MNLQETALATEVLRPGDDGYDEAARVFFAAGRPAMVVRPRDPDEVAAALRDAVRHGLAVSVRSGGHSGLGHGTNTDGMVIDLRAPRRDRGSRRRAAPGARRRRGHVGQGGRGARPARPGADLG